MKIVRTLLLFAAFISMTAAIPCYAQTKSVEVQGIATTREGAIDKALIQAIQQVRGMSLQAATQAVRAAASASRDGKSSSFYGSAQRTDVRTQSQGVISRYEITNETKDDGLWNVTLTAHIAVYKTPGHSPKSRRKLAILDFKASRSLRSRNIPQVLLQKLTDSLVQSRRFAIVDREENALYQQEKTRWSSNDIALEEKAKFGMRLGADYVVTGNILSFTTSSVMKEIEMTGESYAVERIAAEVAYKVIVPATMQVKWSSTVTYNVTTEPDNRSSQGALAARLSNKIAQKISADLLQAIYPIKVINVSGDIVYLNMGGINVKKGQRFTVYHLGERLVDPYTHESLGRMEAEAGTATIITVKPKFAIAKISNQLDAIVKGDICRKAANRRSPRKTVQRKSSTVNYSDSGGVKLPFD